MFKIGEKVICIDDSEGIHIRKGESYIVDREVGVSSGREEIVSYVGLRGICDGACVYRSRCFKLVEDDMKIKITKWEDLDGIENGKYKIANETNFICIEKGSENADLVIPKDVFDIKETIAIINSLDFDIEFTEPIKLTRKQHNFVRSVDKGYVSRKQSGHLCFSIKKANSMENDSWTYFDKLVDFPFIKQGEEWSIESLRKLECEEDV